MLRMEATCRDNIKQIVLKIQFNNTLNIILVVLFLPV